MNNNRSKYKAHVVLALIALCAVSCLHDCGVSDEVKKAMAVTFTVKHPAQLTRATDAGFADGDRIGVYMAPVDAILEIGGNTVNNEALTCNGGAWSASRTLYWDEGTYNVYAYYPYVSSLSSVEDMPVRVCTDQSAVDEATGLNGYEASDFLYARTEGVSASEDPVNLTFRHIMSKLTVRLVKGEDFKGEMPTTAEVYVHNVVPTATVDLSVGVATRDMHGREATLKARQQSDYIYSAIIVPQRITSRRPLVEVEMKGVSYLYESTFVFKPGTEHFVNIVISDSPDNIKIEIGGELQGWQ